MDQPQISQRVPDLHAFIKTRTADHPVRQPQGHEALFELAGLRAGAHQDRHLGQRRAFALRGLDLLADEARLGFAVPQAVNLELLALIVVGPQRLAEPAFVMGDQTGRRAQDMAGRAVVTLQATQQMF